jgi:16S rRNA processing protein RimM
VKDLIEIGKIGRPHGLKGAVKVSSYLESDEVVCRLKEIFIKMERGVEAFRLKKAKLNPKGFLLELVGIDDANAAEKLAGHEILMRAEDLDVLPEGEYYWKDLIGLAVQDGSGKVLGVIESIFPTGSNDVLVCRGGEREILLPAIAEVIRDVNIEKGRVIVNLLEGL